ncbi:MAG: FAD-dependent oxidoreductase [Pseudomonadota bacterium]
MTVGLVAKVVYAAHNLSILSHFLSPYINQRTDEYGGTFENRLRLLREVLEDTRDAVGRDRAVALRFSVEDADPSHQLSAEGEGRDVVEALADLPDLWDVNLSGWSADSSTARFAEEGFQDAFVSFVKQVTDKPVVGVGRYTSADTMVRLVRTGALDLIGAARPSIADPFLPAKIRDDRIDDIRECIGCNICVASDSYGIPIRCTQNPTIAEEWRRSWHPEVIPSAEQELNVLIVGSGPAGLECAWTLARAGHHVTLAEERDEFGGRAVRESTLSGLSSWRRVADYRIHQLQQQGNVELFLNSSLGAEDVLEFGADHVVLATGSAWRRDGVGSSRYNSLDVQDETELMTPDDILAGDTPGARVLIYDDDNFYMGGVLAEHLARAGHGITIATPMPELSAWTGHTLEQARIVRRLAELGVIWHTNLSLEGVVGDQARFCCSFTGSSKAEIEFDTLLMLGAKLPRNELSRALQDELPDGHLWSAGDCLVPGIIQAAVYSGHRTARLINGDQLAGARFRREISGLAA